MSDRTYPTPIDPALVVREIIGTNQTYPVGVRRVGLHDAFGRRAPEQPWVVLREATYDEWVARITAKRGGQPPDAESIALAQSAGVRFYEISTD